MNIYEKVEYLESQGWEFSENGRKATHPTRNGYNDSTSKLSDEEYFVLSVNHLYDAHMKEEEDGKAKV